MGDQHRRAEWSRHPTTVAEGHPIRHPALAEQVSERDSVAVRVRCDLGQSGVAGLQHAGLLYVAARGPLGTAPAGTAGPVVSRVEINADGRQVIVDADGLVDDLAKVAISLWEHAESYRPMGPAVGFASADRRASYDLSVNGMGANRRVMPAEPARAEGDRP